MPISPKAFIITLLTLLSSTSAMAQAQGQAEDRESGQEQGQRPTLESVPAWEVDWVPLADLTAEQREALGDPLCCGVYLDPDSLEPDNSPTTPPTSPTAQDRTHIEADSVEGFLDESDIITLEGNVRAQQLDVLVTGDRGEYARNSQHFNLQGNVRARQPGLLLSGEQGSVDNQAGSMQLENASYVLHEPGFRGAAKVIVYTDEAGVVTIDNGHFSRCEPGNNDWVVNAARIKLDRDSGRGSALHATLRVRDIPVLYTPYISFPITDERSSGFLLPSIGTTKDGGLDLTLPYYFNLAPNYDATYTPRFMSDRGLQHGFEMRHLNRYTENQINLGYLPSDDRYDAEARRLLDEALENDTPLPRGVDSPPTEERWLINAQHRGRYGNNWSSLIDYQGVSDDDYFRDFASDGIQVSARSYLRRRGSLRYSGDIWQLETSLENYQIIDPDLNNQRLDFSLWPQVDLSGEFSTDFNLSYGIDSQYTYFDRSQDADEFTQRQIDAGAMAQGGRLNNFPFIRYNWVTPGIFVTPELRYYQRDYQLEHQAIGAKKNPSVGILSGSVDAGLIFERDLELFGSQYQQTLEPRLFYLNNEYADQSDIPLFDSRDLTFSYNQLFRHNAFSGYDRISDTEQVTVAVGTRFFDERGREVASAGIGQIHYFKDRRVTLNNRITDEETRDSSNIAAELDYRFNRAWRVRSYLEWNSDDNTIDAGSFQFQYQSDINQILNLGLRFRDRDIRRRVSDDGFDRRILQSDIQAAWPLSEQWGVVGRYNYDHANERPLEQLAGIEYKNCCWNLRLVYREWLDRLDQRERLNARKDYGLFLQFELKGLGSVLGGDIGGILEDAIRGYRQ